MASLGDDETGLRIPALRPHRDRLAEKVYIPVAIAGEGPIGQFDGVSIDDCINGRLNRGVVSRPIRCDEVGRGRDGRGENCA